MNSAHARPYRARSGLLLAALAALALAGCAKDAAPEVADGLPADAAPRADVPADAAPDPITAATSANRLAKADYNPAVAKPSEYHDLPKTEVSDVRKEMLKPYTNLGPVESRYFSAKYVTDAALDALRKKDFQGEVDALGNEAGADGMAKQKAYTQAFQAALVPHGNTARLQGLSCGRVACMGSLYMTNPELRMEIATDVRASGLPMPSLAWQPIRLGQGWDVRFIFTTQGHGGFHSRGR